MKNSHRVTGSPTSTPPAGFTPKQIHLRGLIIAIIFLLLCFSVPLLQLVRFALSSDLYSHLILIPFIGAYLVWLRRDRFAPTGAALSPVWAGALILAGLMVGGHMLSARADATSPQDHLAFAMYSLVLLFAGICCLFLNRSVLRAIAFPLGFLLLLAPFPTAVESGLETVLQSGSTVVAQSFFQLIGTPVFRDGTLLHLPGFTLEVAPECSGIHSTLALFVTSLVAGQILLRSTWSRTVLAAAVLPIALIRNGLRVTTIGELCVRIGPEMIDSYIHRHGGPIFFAISLVPFSLLLFLLLKADRKSASQLNTVA